jgi:aspartate 1-decarboxylase
MFTFMDSQLTAITVTRIVKAQYDYIAIGRALMEASEIEPYRQVQVLNLNTSHTWTTIIVRDDDGPNSVTVSDIHYVNIGDPLTITSFARADHFHSAMRILVDAGNVVRKIDLFKNRP